MEVPPPCPIDAHVGKADEVVVPAFHGGYTTHHQAKPLTPEEYYRTYGERMKVPPISKWEQQMAERNNLGIPSYKLTPEEWAEWDRRSGEEQREKDNSKLQKEVERIYQIEDHQLEGFKLDGPMQEFFTKVIPERTARRSRAYALIFRLTAERRMVFFYAGRVVVAPAPDADTMREVDELDTELGYLLDEKAAKEHAERMRQYPSDAAGDGEEGTNHNPQVSAY